MRWSGEQLSLLVLGTSHAAKIGAGILGLPPGYAIDMQKLDQHMARRRATDALSSTPRREPDIPNFLTGLRGGVTTGEHLVVEIVNVSTRGRDYDALADIPRPSHADYPHYIKTGGEPLVGGGAFSGRMTAPFHALGGVAKQMLEQEGVTVCAKVEQIGDGSQDAIARAKQDGDSVGGTVTCTATGLPVGLGGAMFLGLESKIAPLLFGIPAVKGVEFGSGFALATMRGSEANDAYYFDGDVVKTRTNHSGGIVGGMSNGMPLTLRVVIKPTPSIACPQESVNLKTKQSVPNLVIGGRHDSCIVPRAAAVVESAVAIALLDTLLAAKKEKTNHDKP